MPTLEELFKTKVITEGPNTGKTAETAYAIRDSKSFPVGSSNFLLKKINQNTTGGFVGKLINSFDFVEKINERRKKYSVRESESFSEEEQLGLKQFATFTRPVIYGGDIFRISNRRTRTISFIKNKANMGSGLLGISDSIGNAAGNFAGDYVNNLFAGRKGKDAVPPPPDLMALGTEIGVNVVDKLVGSILPMPMVPSKVAEEIQKRASKNNTDFSYEFNRDKAIKRLANSNKVVGFVDGLLKENKNLPGQSKDFIARTAANLVSKLVKAGVKKLIDSGVNAIVKSKKQKKLAKQSLNTSGAQGYVSAILGKEDTPWSSTFPYSKQADYEITRTLSEQTTLKAIYLQTRAERMKAKGMSLPESQPGFRPGPDDTIPEGATAFSDEKLLDALNKEPEITYSNRQGIAEISRDTGRAMSTRADGINLTDDIIYPGTSVIDEETKRNFDSFDFIPLKFYSIAKDSTVQFRCTVTDFTETFTPEWESHKFIGNPFPFYTYTGIERSATFSFKVFSLSLVEHMNVWQKLDFLGKLTMPQSFKGISGAVVPPIIKFTLGDLYVNKPAFIENLSFSVNEDSPWEIGLNRKILNGTEVLKVPNVQGYITYLEADISSGGHKLPMIIDVEVSLKFLESRKSIENNDLYAYTTPGTQKSLNDNKPVPPNYYKF